MPFQLLFKDGETKILVTTIPLTLCGCDRICLCPSRPKKLCKLSDKVFLLLSLDRTSQRMGGSPGPGHGYGASISTILGTVGIKIIKNVSRLVLRP